MLAFQVVGGVPRPDGEHVIDRLDEHCGAVRVQVAEDLGVGQQAPRADAEQESPLGQMVDHGHLRCHHSRMMVRQVHRPGAESDPLRRLEHPGDKDQAGGDCFGRIGDMLAEETFTEAKRIGNDGELPVLLVCLDKRPTGRVERHREET